MIILQILTNDMGSRSKWTYQETEVLLDVLIDQQTITALDSRSTPHAVVYSELKRQMEAHGICRRLVVLSMSHLSRLFLLAVL